MVDGEGEGEGASAGWEGGFNTTFGPRKRIHPVHPFRVGDDIDRRPYSIYDGCGLRKENCGTFDHRVTILDLVDKP